MPSAAAATRASASWRQTTVQRGVARGQARRRAGRPVSWRPSRSASASTATRLREAEQRAAPRRPDTRRRAGARTCVPVVGAHGVERLLPAVVGGRGQAAPAGACAVGWSVRRSASMATAPTTSAGIESASARLASSARGRRANASPDAEHRRRAGAGPLRARRAQAGWVAGVHLPAAARERLGRGAARQQPRR